MKTKAGIEPVLSINIMSPTGKGKSAIAELIRQTLNKAGFEVELNDPDRAELSDAQQDLIAATLDVRLATIRGRGDKIVIRTLQTARSPSHE